ncbi:MAG: HEAT repeat domain-containing protein [Saprospirales bacterium]|nr:HEAT repeat domain-containing protein [Saprospirales bacterium]
MKYSSWFILGCMLLGSHLTYCQSPDYSNNIDEFVSQIEQLEKDKDQWVDSLIQVAMDTLQSVEVRRSAFMALGKVRSEKALKFLVDSYNTRVAFPDKEESLADQFPAVQSLYNSPLNDFDLVIKLVFQSLDTDESRISKLPY